MNRKRIFNAAEKLREENYAALNELAAKLEEIAENSATPVVEALAEILH